MRASLLSLLCVAAAVAASGEDDNSGAGFVKRITTVEEFESDVLNNQDIWLVVFSAMSDDPTKLRGVDREKCEKVENAMTDIAVELHSLGVQVALADVDDISALASEFNVRKRMLPMAMLFKTRIRDGDAFKDLSNIVDEKQELRMMVEAALEENPRRSDGQPQKIMLAVGGGEL